MSSVLVFLLIGVAVMTVVASVVAVLPSKHQRAVARARAKAIQLGLNVQLVRASELEALNVTQPIDGLIWYRYCISSEERGEALGVEDARSFEVVFNQKDDSIDAVLKGVVALPSSPSSECEKVGLSDRQAAVVRAMASTLGKRLVAVKFGPLVAQCLWQETEQIDDVAWLAAKLESLTVSGEN